MNIFKRRKQSVTTQVPSMLSDVLEEPTLGHELGRRAHAAKQLRTAVDYMIRESVTARDHVYTDYVDEMAAARSAWVDKVLRDLKLQEWDLPRSLQRKVDSPPASRESRMMLVEMVAEYLEDYIDAAS